VELGPVDGYLADDGGFAALLEDDVRAAGYGQVTSDPDLVE